MNRYCAMLEKAATPDCPKRGMHLSPLIPCPTEEKTTKYQSATWTKFSDGNSNALHRDRLRDQQFGGGQFSVRTCGGFAQSRGPKMDPFRGDSPPRRQSLL